MQSTKFSTINTGPTAAPTKAPASSSEEGTQAPTSETTNGKLFW